MATCHPDRKAHGKGLCTSCYGKWWRSTFPEKWAAKCARRRATYPKSGRNYHRKVKFGLTPESFQILKEGQNNACAICKSVFSENFPQLPRVDHDHQTNKIRGLLCYRCNSGLGFFQDNIELMRSAINYIVERK